MFYRFRKSHYHNVPLQKELKEVKECRETFRSIQAPYKKALEHLNKLKKAHASVSLYLVLSSYQVLNKFVDGLFHVSIEVGVDQLSVEFFCLFSSVVFI